MNETMKLLSGEHGESLQMIAANAAAFAFNLEAVKAARRYVRQGTQQDKPPLIDEREPTPQEKENALHAALKIASAAWHLHTHACDSNPEAQSQNGWRKCATWRALAPKPEGFVGVFKHTMEVMKLCGSSQEEAFAAATKAAEAAAASAAEEWKTIAVELDGNDFPFEGDVEDAAAEIEAACHTWGFDLISLTADAVRRERTRALSRLQAGKYANPDPEPLLWLKAQ